MTSSLPLSIESSHQSPVNPYNGPKSIHNWIADHADTFEFSIQQQSIIDVVKSSSVRISLSNTKTTFDGSGTLVGKVNNHDGSSDYYVLTAAHLSERENHKVDIRLLNGRIFEGIKFNAGTRDLALIQFTIQAGDTQIADNDIAIVSDMPPTDQQRTMIAGFPVSTKSYPFKGINDPVIKHNLRLPAKPATHPSEGEKFSDLVIDTESYISLNAADVGIAKKEAQQNNPFTSDSHSVLPIIGGNTAIGMSGGGIWGISTKTGSPVVYAVHNGRVLESTTNMQQESQWTDPVTRLNRVTAVGSKEIQTVIMRIRQYLNKDK